ncbi:WecB/TagA/CpsF family glycosyltransferase [Enterovibrio baiacu]|uniref:WecB/TagA/CpsF family glycosyltransferase n=1 Tax=Enterovibrio baiacu TaxID=2491023 RepID=UPI001F0C0E13|nr:WecB/TagA/CpsF family glycosyltransferase [Enterovibrio baiacu]
MKKINILGFDVSTESVNEIVRKALSNSRITIVNTINPHSYVETKTDSTFRDALIESDELIPDGAGISIAANFLHGKEVKKIAGFDLFEETMSVINGKSGKVFFLGSSEAVLKAIEERVIKEYSNVKVKTLSPPFKPEFSAEDITKFSQAINEFSPDVVFVGLTAPKQEKLIKKISGCVDTKMISGIGAVFDFFAGTVKRPNKIWISLNLEWLGRLIAEPKRLWRRNFVSTPIFLFDLVKGKLMKKKASLAQ